MKTKNLLELKLYEKATVLTFLACLSLLCLYALKAPEERWPHDKHPERKRQIVVTITGEIENEGRYHFEQGTTLRDALQGLILKPEIQTHLKLDLPLKAGQKIRIKKEKKIINKRSSKKSKNTSSAN